MDPALFGKSEIELKHEPYGPITREAIGDANKGKVAVVTGAGRGRSFFLSWPEIVRFD
jgi:hypothetical protein